MDVGDNVYYVDFGTQDSGVVIDFVKHKKDRKKDLYLVRWNDPKRYPNDPPEDWFYPAQIDELPPIIA